MDLKSKLKEQAKKKLATQNNTSLPNNKNKTEAIMSLDNLTKEIQVHLVELNEIKEFFLEKRKRVAYLREKIIQSLIYVRDNRKTLLRESFENYLEEKIGITKGYFYEQVQAYELCQKYNQIDYFSLVDYKILVYIARIKDEKKQKELFFESQSFTRESIKTVSQTDSTNKSKNLVKIEKESKEIKLIFDKDLSSQEMNKLLKILEAYYSIKH